MARSVICLALMLALAGAASAAEEATPPADAANEKPTQGKVIKIEIIGEKAVTPTSGDDGEARTRRLTQQQRMQRQREVQRRWRRPEASDVRRGQP